MVVTHVFVPCSKAAKLILLGYNMLPPKPAAEYAKESCDLLMGDSFNTAEWQLKQLVLQLTDRDIEWVMHLGFYKLAYRSVSSTLTCSCCISFCCICSMFASPTVSGLHHTHCTVVPDKYAMLCQNMYMLCHTM